MIKELEKEEDLIRKLESSFNYVISDVKIDLVNNPFSHYIVYIENNMILGFINYYFMYDRIEIANFNVLDEYQNHKIGSKLLEYLINKYQNSVDNITLEVRCDNEKAIHLYKKYGFIKKAIRQNYYNGVDGLLFELEMR